MKLGVSRQLIISTPGRWAKQYADTQDARKAEITARLSELDPSVATSEDVAKIIGNKSWSYFTCDECSQYVEQVVELGEYERTVTLCASCVRAASALASVVLP